LDETGVEIELSFVPCTHGLVACSHESGLIKEGV